MRRGNGNCPNAVGSIILDQSAKLDFRQQLKDARETAFRDAEAFDGIIHVVERLGCLLCGCVKSMGGYRDYIEELAKSSALAASVPNEWRALHVPFSRLYSIVKDGRNDAMHQGTFARHLTIHAIELALILEDALRVDGTAKVSDFMVRNPVCAALWQPISYVRQQMLVNSFSYLPVRNEKNIWCLISDLDVAKYLAMNAPGQRNQRLAISLSASRILQAEQNDFTAELVPETLSVTEAMSQLNDKPLLVHRSENPAEIVGILTAFDLL